MTWQRVRIRILAHPTLLVGEEYNVERDEQGYYYLDGYDGDGIEHTATIFSWEAEEVKDAIPTQ
jgi:hypothetical protein